MLLSFQTHRHPYICLLIENLVAAHGAGQSGGIEGLLNIGSQNLSNGFDFNSGTCCSRQPPPGQPCLDLICG